MLSKFGLYIVCLFILSSCTNNVIQKTSHKSRTINVQTSSPKLTKKYCEKLINDNSNINNPLKNYCLRQFPTEEIKTEPWRHLHILDYKICKDKIYHVHKFKNKKHKHYYTGGCWVKKQKRKSAHIDVRALQKKLKVKGYYRGPINGAVSPETKKALLDFMKNRKK